MGLAAHDVVLGGVPLRAPLASKQPPHGRSTPVRVVPCFWAVSLKAFVLVAGGDVSVINIDHLLGLPYCEWALSRGNNRCRGTYATNEKSMLINLFKGLRCRGVECGGGGGSV